MWGVLDRFGAICVECKEEVWIGGLGRVAETLFSHGRMTDGTVGGEEQKIR